MAETYEEWETRLKKVCADARRKNFEIGDCLLEGELNYGEHYSQGMEETRLSYDTLAHIKYVCSRVSRETRHPDLSFTHHRLIAHFPPVVQSTYLELAAAQNMSAQAFRQRIKGEDTSQKKHCKICGKVFEKAHLKRVTACEECRKV